MFAFNNFNYENILNKKITIKKSCIYGLEQILKHELKFKCTMDSYFLFSHKI